jgi:hypothetical protein
MASQADQPALNRVPVAPFRETFIRLERRGLVSRSSLALQLGWIRRASGSGVGLVGDAGKVNRVLGLKSSEPQTTMRYETGVALCRALDIDPVDVGV